MAEALARETPVMDRLVRRSLQRTIPLSVHFDLTYQCNERCVHCYLDEHDRAAPAAGPGNQAELSTAEVMDVLDQLREAGTLFLTFSGGEIFLRADLFELLSYARKLHFDIALKTNGTLVDAECARKLKELGVRKVQVSIYSADAALHDSITGLPGSFQRSLRALRLLKEQGLQVSIACPLLQQNVAGFRAVRALAGQLGATAVFDPTITGMFDGRPGALAMRVPAAGLLPMLSDPALNPLPLSHPDAPNGAPVAADSFDGVPCSAAHNSCYIAPGGDVYPCVQLPVLAGNVRRRPFSEIWRESTEMCRVRSMTESGLATCSACAIRAYCHRCPGLALLESGSLYGPDDRACELAQQTAQLAGTGEALSA